MIQQKLTVVITGHFVYEFDKYLDYLLRSIPDELKSCLFLVYYDKVSHDQNVDNEEKLINECLQKNLITDYKIKFNKGGLLANMYHAIQDVNTDTFLFIEHDWVFLTKVINFSDIVDAILNNNFVNMVQFKKMGNIQFQLMGFRDREGNVLPFVEDSRVKEINAIQCCYWCNNPFVVRHSKMKEWMRIFIDDTVERYILNHQCSAGSTGIEEKVIMYYQNDLNQNLWDDIKDNWGTYIYGKVGDTPYIGHTDGSRHYNGVPEELGQNWITENY